MNIADGPNLPMRRCLTRQRLSHFELAKLGIAYGSNLCRQRLRSLRIQIFGHRKESSEMKLYIAYGSNLCKLQMRQRCPSARPLGKFMLNHARLVFRNVADLEYVPGEKTPCGLWAINKADEDSLDIYEGLKSGAYFKSDEIKLNYLGQSRRALIYLMNSTGIYPPSQTYADIVRKGYQDFGLDEDYLEAAIARSFTDKEPDLFIAARRRRQIDNGGTHRRLVERPLDITEATAASIADVDEEPNEPTYTE
jgi:hypothetical protein